MGSKTQAFRRLTQSASLLILVLFPVLEAYKVLLKYMNSVSIGSLGEQFQAVSTMIPMNTGGGYLSWLVIGVDFIAGLITKNTSTLQYFLSLFNGSFWSITIAGIHVADPLALLQTLVLGQPVPVSFIIAAAIPVAFAVIFGRVFCSWICPANTLMEFTRNMVLKIGIRPAEKQFVTNRHLKYYLLAAGLALPFFGHTIFSYILPYVLIGKFFYYLTVNRVFWGGIGLVTFIMIIDALVQRGFWCNYLCPTGALLSLLGKLRLINIRHTTLVCNEGCSLCVSSCTWQADPRIKHSFNCTNCAGCIDQCPSGALSFGKPDPNLADDQEYDDEEQISA